eukprot:m51a1_g10858 putative protein kinase (342) ;mRNA; r:38232-39562
MDTVYVSQWDAIVFNYLSFSINESRRCGKEFDDPEGFSGDSNTRTLALAIAIPGGTVLGALLVAAVVVKSRGGATLKRLKRNEIEIGERIGKGQFGTVHNGDWHGTPVAIRVIDKAAITREDLEVIKGEMELIHSLHHPNLLMLLGYCDSSKDLLVVSEYMANGSLHEYLKKNKQNMNYFNQVAIAFIDGSMVTKLCDFWCSTGKNSTATSSARRRCNWLAPELIEGKPATTATDVFAFAIVLWELFLPAELYITMTDSSKSSSVSVSHSSAQQQGAELQPTASQQQSTVPEIHPSTPKEVVTLLTHCWQKEPERRPSIFQILRNWPQTFSVREDIPLMHS